MGFGSFLKELRQQQKIGIKKVAKDLGVDYSYISKLENDKANPSDQLVDRLADYFECDKDLLYLAANKVPEDAMEALRQKPKEAMKYLRGLLKHGEGKRPG